MNNKTHTESSAVKAAGITIYGDIDSRNRQILFDIFEDGSAMTREITHHTGDAARPSKETYREKHAANSERARLILLLREEQK
jgi:hypothetical protein